MPIISIDLSDNQQAILFCAFARPDLTDSEIDRIADVPKGYTRRLKNREAGQAFLAWGEKLGLAQALAKQLNVPMIFVAVIEYYLSRQPSSENGSIQEYLGERLGKTDVQ